MCETKFFAVSQNFMMIRVVLKKLLKKVFFLGGGGLILPPGKIGLREKLLQKITYQ